MCPLCISSLALTVAGATSTGALSTFVFARILRKQKTQQPDWKETIHHDDDSHRAPEHSFAR
jgi:hypothetical protein